MEKPIIPNKIFHSPINFYHHFQKLVEEVGLETIERDAQYQIVREARVGAVLSLIMFGRLNRPTYFQMFKPDPPDLILMQPSQESYGTRDITQIEVSHYVGTPKESLLERVKRKDPPGRHHYSDNYILVYNIGIGLEPNFNEVCKYLNHNNTPFPIWAIQEIPNQSDTTARLVIVNPEKYETTINIGLSAHEFQKLKLPDVIHSKRAGSIKSVRMEKSEKFEIPPWESIGI